MWLALLAAETAVVSHVERSLDAHRVPLPWYEVLVCLARAPQGRLRMQDLASAVLLSGSGATRVVEKMESAKLLRREAAVDDQRGRTCSITDAGRKLLADVQPDFFRALDACVGERLTQAEQRTLATLLSKLAYTSAGSP